MRRELPAEYKREAEARQRQMKRAVAALYRAAAEIDSIQGQSGHPGVDNELEVAETSIRKMLDMLV